MNENEKVLVCLGGGLELDQTPKPWVIPRLEKTVELFQQGGYPKIITTSKGTFSDPNLDGHAFTDLSKYPVTEAEASRRFLLQRGIPDSAILVEAQSKDTVLH